MNQEIKLKLQAYLDGELQGRELRRIAALLDSDSEARALYSELEGLKVTLVANEPEIKVPETREFYWSAIERRIQEQPAKPTVSAFLPGYPTWLRVLAPAFGAALLLMVALTAIKLAIAPAALTYLHEIETPSEETSAISFHSEAAGMTVVWVQTR
jgi:anti-sigma factor RsiW